MRKYRFIAVAIFVTFFYLVLVIAYFIVGIEGETKHSEIGSDKSIKMNAVIQTETATIEAVPTITLQPTITNKGNDKKESPATAPKVLGSTAMASITISTANRIKTYDIMSDVSEQTLENNVGHLPSSAMPGEEGLCVLMGHRDAGFKILIDIEIGDMLVITFGDKKYTYQVTKIIISESDNDLRFDAEEDSVLVLVTCYPFRYSGHAPQKYTIYANMIYFIDIIARID